MSQEGRLVVTLCNSSTCSHCPTVSVDDAAEDLKQVIINDDFGGTVRISKEQFAVLEDFFKSGSAL